MLGRFCERIHAVSFRTKLAAVSSVAAVTAAIAMTAGVCGLRLNLTNSVPIGLYLISDAENGQLVEFCPPEPFGTLSRERGYRETSRFGCRDGAKPLLKPVAARPGDTVITSATGLVVDGRSVPHTTPLEADSAGRRIRAWPFGVYSVTKGSLWVASSFNIHSFDSRYFGPVPESAVLHHLRPLWVSR